MINLSDGKKLVVTEIRCRTDQKWGRVEYKIYNTDGSLKLGDSVILRLTEFVEWYNSVYTTQESLENWLKDKLRISGSYEANLYI